MRLSRKLKAVLVERNDKFRIGRRISVGALRDGHLEICINSDCILDEEIQFRVQLRVQFRAETTANNLPELRVLPTAERVPEETPKG